MRYREIKTFGVGGFGEVALAIDTRLNRRVVLKRLHDHLAERPNIVVALRAEALAQARLEHPHIARVYDFHTVDGQPAIVMELAKGCELANHIGADDLTLDQRFLICIQIAEALSYAHLNGIVHRDLKPENVVVGPSMQYCKLLDFGIAATVRHEGTVAAPPVAGGSGIYQSPESRGMSPATTSKVDVWSFGCVLHEVFRGRRLRSGDAPSTLASALSTGGREPRSVRSIVRDCLAVDPERRPEMAEVAKRLHRARSEAARRRNGMRIAAATTGIIALGSLAVHLWPATPLSVLNLNVDHDAALETIEIVPARDGLRRYLRCTDDDGTRLWQLDGYLRGTVCDTTWDEVLAWGHVLAQDSAPPEIIAMRRSRHKWLAGVGVYDAKTGRIQRELWSSGHLEHPILAELPDERFEHLLVGGTHQRSRRAVLLALDPDRLGGAIDVPPEGVNSIATLPGLLFGVTFVQDTWSRLIQQRAHVNQVYEPKGSLITLEVLAGPGPLSILYDVAVTDTGVEVVDCRFPDLFASAWRNAQAHGVELPSLAHERLRLMTEATVFRRSESRSR